MKFDVEIDFNYPGIENDPPEMRQYNLQLLLERGAETFNDDVDEECTCTGNIIRCKLSVGTLVYYKKSPAPETYDEPTRSQFEDLKTIPGVNVENVTYEQFCEASKKGYEAGKKRGYMLAMHSKSVEYKDADDLEKIKDELRTEEGFIGFPCDKIVEDLHTSIQDMLNDNE